MELGEVIRAHKTELQTIDKLAEEASDSLLGANGYADHDRVRINTALLRVERIRVRLQKILGSL